MKTYRLVLSILILIITLPIPALGAEFTTIAYRPSLRSVKNNGSNNNKGRIDRLRKNSKAPLSKEIKTYTNNMMGIRIKHPEDWKASKSTVRSHGLFLANRDVVLNDKSTKLVSEDPTAEGVLIITMKEHEAPPTLSDLEASLNEYIAPPENDYAQLKRSKGYRKYERINLKQTEWKGLPALSHTFTAGEIGGEVRGEELIIAVGNRSYSLRLFLMRNQYNRNTHLFTEFIDSLYIRHTATTRSNASLTKKVNTSSHKTTYRSFQRRRTIRPRNTSSSQILEKIERRKARRSRR